MTTFSGQAGHGHATSLSRGWDVSKTSTGRDPIEKKQAFLAVPFVDLMPVHRALRNEFHEALDHALFTDSLILGASLEAFEHDFARAVDTAFCAGVSNGADALELIFRAVLQKHDDEVIVPTNSFFASASAVSLAGATPVFCDVQEDGLLSADTVLPALSNKTRAVLAVHLYGQCVDMKPLEELAKQRGFLLIEDAAQAHGATYDGRPAGSLGDAAAFSFYPTKNLGALGDAGAVTSDDPDLFHRICQMRNYGSTKKYFHDEVGKNARMDSLQAAFLSIKLRRLQKGIARRRAVASTYLQRLADLPIEPIAVRNIDEHAFHLFVILLPSGTNRAALQAYLAARGIQTAVHYPRCIHKQQAYMTFQDQQLPVAEAMAERMLSLPLYEAITDQQVNWVVDSLASYAWNETKIYQY